MSKTSKPKTLDELAADPLVGLPTSNYEFCIAGGLNTEMEEIDEALNDAVAAQGPTRLNGTSPEVTRLNNRREKLRKQMAEYTVTLTFRAKPGHEWRRWVSQHPARKDDELDEQLGFNVDALSDSVRDYVVSINGEPVTDQWWQMIADNAAPGNIWKMTAIVRNLHQREMVVPKSLTSLLQSREIGRAYV